MTDIKDISKKDQGRLFYDATCRFCCRSIARLRPWLSRLNVETVAFSNGAAEPEMRLVWDDGREFGGADAAIFLTGRLWWTKPLHCLAAIPNFRKLVHFVYRQIAARRHCLNGACDLPPVRPRKRIPLGLAWMIATILIAFGWTLQLRVLPEVSPWLVMWIMATAQWIAFKFIAWTRTSTRPHFAFWMWVGMDAQAFTARKPAVLPLPTGTIQAIAFVLIGCAMLGIGFPKVASDQHTILAGWTAMLALIATLHFGFFALMANAWNRLGYRVAPIMRAPWRADSLADFWGARWNRAFSDVTRISVFRPLVRRFGMGIGTLAGFLLSGIAHEIVISLPARAGWGLPTLYFVIQGLGIVADRALFPKNRAPRLRRCFTWFVILAPAPLLFHAAFLETVITPGFTHLLQILIP